MKRIFVSGLLLIFGLAAAGLFAQSQAQSLEFKAPTIENPCFHIQFAFIVKKIKTAFQSLQMDGKPVADILVFKDGAKVELGAPLDPGIYTFILDFAWRANKAYKIVLSHLPAGAKKPSKAEFGAFSPEDGGIPSLSCEEGFYRIVKIEEEAGLGRKSEIVTATLTAPKSTIEDGRFCLFDGAVQIPYQVLDTKENTPSEAAAKDHPVTLTTKIAFPVQVAGRQTKLISVFKGEKGPFEEKGFEVTGEGLGKTVRNSVLALGFHPQSGQINTMEYFKEGVKLYNKAGVIHWNPDCFVPGVAWDHSFDWNPPAVFEEKRGEFLYRNFRSGPLPRVKDVDLEVLYTLEIDAPWILSETRMTARNDLAVIAVRNDEMVFSKELFDSLIYKSRRQGIVQMSLQAKPGVPFGLVSIGPEDADWVGLLNTKEDYGVFCLRIKDLATVFGPAGAFLHKPGTYFYAPSDGEYVYWVRPLLYTWADYSTNNLLTALPKGSVFYEKNAYLFLKLGRDYREKLDFYLQTLRNPLKVF
jgi:hypothetical protein